MGDPGQGPPIFAGGAVRPRAFVPGDHRAKPPRRETETKRAGTNVPALKLQVYAAASTRRTRTVAPMARLALPAGANSVSVTPVIRPASPQ